MSNKETLNWNLLQSGQALDKTAAWKLSNANAVFVGIRSCCLLPSHWNNFEDQVRAVGDISVPAIVEGTRTTFVLLSVCSVTCTCNCVV